MVQVHRVTWLFFLSMNILFCGDVMSMESDRNTENKKTLSFIEREIFFDEVGKIGIIPMNDHIRQAEQGVVLQVNFAIEKKHGGNTLAKMILEAIACKQNARKMLMEFQSNLKEIIQVEQDEDLKVQLQEQLEFSDYACLQKAHYSDHSSVIAFKEEKKKMFIELETKFNAIMQAEQDPNLKKQMQEQLKLLRCAGPQSQGCLGDYTLYWDEDSHFRCVSIFYHQDILLKTLQDLVMAKKIAENTVPKKKKYHLS